MFLLRFGIIMQIVSFSLFLFLEKKNKSAIEKLNSTLSRLKCFTFGSRFVSLLWAKVSRGNFDAERPSVSQVLDGLARELQLIVPLARITVFSRTRS